MKKTLIVGADPFPPYQFIDENGNIKGLDYELIKNIVESMGYEPEFIIKEWSEIERMFREKKIDMVFQVQKTPERERYYYFSDKLRDAITVIITNINKSIKCKDLKELGDEIIKNRWKLGVLRGYQYGEIIDKLPEKNKASFSTTESLLEAVNKSDVELGVIDLDVFNYYKEKYKYENLKVIENASFTRPLYVIFNDAVLRDEFNKHLRKYLKK